MYTKRDLLFSIVTGFYTGFIAWQIFEFLEVPLFRGISFAWLVVFVPVLWILGVNLGYFLGRWFSFFNQFGKFAAIGFTNAAVDFGILNLLIFYFGIAAGVWFSVFKGISFITAAVHSYFWNKYWTFEAGNTPVTRKEFTKFFAVTIFALLVNVGIASFVFQFVGHQGIIPGFSTPRFGLTSEAWANIGAVAGSAAALIVSFIGFKTAVFKK